MSVKIVYKTKIETEFENINIIIKFLEKQNYEIKACYIYTFKNGTNFVVFIVEQKGSIFFFGKEVPNCEFCDDVIYRLHTEPDYIVLSYFIINYSLTVEEIRSKIKGFKTKTIYTTNENYISLI